MRIAPTVVALVIGGSSVAFAAPARTYVGLITDTICVTDHKAMKVAPDMRQCGRGAGNEMTQISLRVRSATV